MEQITVKNTVNAPVARVWELWNQPEHITKWNSPSDDWHCPKAENDLKPGGKLHSRMEAKDGSFGFDFEAIYDEVVDHKKIAYTMTDGRRATTHFENLGDKTEVTTVFDPESENPIEMQRGGWQAILNNFKAYAEKS
ncbi:SRPBCC family protein [Sinomicrobium weinanense]|uniref:SRPBCC family protein n=1 Tax=Sinomicrobium weinanense TaxID=2842200 RepID=A0A926JRF8_9FLAO|nr:SRPBCC family protein [Sinomicrobium weinanense]MBC9795944.1 SRPBCC family protein [Sinomicrobium weinanense]MBU3122063.1 SRPBCC family protein [Sinomicrobium weinanense]